MFKVNSWRTFKSFSIHAFLLARNPPIWTRKTSGNDFLNSKKYVFSSLHRFNLSQELALNAEENQALRSDLESAKSYISDGQNGKSNGEIDLMERRALETQRRLDEVQEELMMMEHQREEESIRLEVALREADEWRQVTLFSRFNLNDDCREQKSQNKKQMKLQS